MAVNGTDSEAFKTQKRRGRGLRGWWEEVSLNHHCPNRFHQRRLKTVKWQEHTTSM